MINKRFVFIDYAKAAGIILVCLGHFLRNGLAVKTALYCFHVPLFFVVSGFLFKTEPPKPWAYIGKNTKRLLIPYCGWFAVAVLRYLPSISKKRVKSLIIDFFMLDGLPVWNQPIWFIPVFFTAAALFCLVLYGLRKREDKTKNLCVAVLTVVCFGAAVLCDRMGMTKVPFGFNKSVMMLGYVCIGYLLRRFFEQKGIGQYTREKKVKSAAVCLAVFIVFFVVAAVLNRGDNISVMSCDFNNILLYIPLSVIGSCAFLMIFLPAKHSRFISLVSSSTIFLMGSHYFLRFWWRNTMPDTMAFDVLGGILATALLIGLCWVLERLARSNHRKAAIPAGWLGFVPTKE